MKKLLSLSAFAAYSISGMAQLPVSTSVENKNAVLEEFTGIYCQYCPDGHARAQAFHDANPADVVLINIHSGGYANPQSGDPDFRTQWGAAIDNQSGLAGYPAGTINRRVFAGMQQGTGTAMSRGDWATAGGTVISESSYANIAVEGDIDYLANTLTVTVETYFTGTAPSGTVKLNVAIMQSGIEGPQTGSSANPAQVLPNGNYIHNHMLRDLLTGQWGVDIPTTTGEVKTYTYVWNIPNDINAIPVSIGDLEIAAFIAETQQNIVTGASGPITFTLPSGVSTADAEAVNSMSIPTDYCAASVTPEFTVKNNESFALDSVEAILDFNGTQVSQWVTNVPANGNKLVTFSPQNLNAGSNTMAFSVSVSNVFKYLDVSSGNNMVAADDINIINPTPNAFPLVSDFEGLPLGGLPSNMIVEDPSGRVYAVDKSVNTQVLTNPIGGYAQSATSLRFDWYSVPAGVVSSLISEKVSLSGANGSEVQFDYAHGLYPGSTGDKLEAFISGDCGQTWVRIWDATSGAGLETAPSPGATRYYPLDASHWKTISAFIHPADGSEIILKIQGTSAFGNSLYIDNIMVDGQPIGISEVNTQDANVYPNPASTNVFVELAEATDFDVELTNTAGQVVRFAQYSNTAKAEMNVEGLPKGIYILNVTSDKGSSSQRITIAD